MSFYSGSDGQLYFASKNASPDKDGTMVEPDGSSEILIAKVRGWSFSSNTATLDVTSLGDTDRTFREGIRSQSGNCSLFYYATNDKTGSVQQLIEQQLGRRVIKNEGDGTFSKDEPGKFSLKLRWGRGKQDDHYIICRVAITSMTITMAVGDMMSCDISFDVNGAPLRKQL